MTKRKQKITTEWTKMLRDLEVGGCFYCTLEEKLSIASIASRLKTENLFYRISKDEIKNKKISYKVLRIEAPINDIKNIDYSKSR